VKSRQVFEIILGQHFEKRATLWRRDR